MKTLYTLIVSLFITAVTSTAFAQSSSGGALPEVRVALPPELASCVSACMSGTSPRPADHAPCASVTDSGTRTRIESLATEVARIRREVNGHAGRLANHERRLRELEGQIGLLSRRTATLESDVTALREEIAGIRRAVASLQSAYELVIRDYVDLSVRVGVLEEQFRTLTGRVDGLDGRMTSLESRMTSTRVGVGAGFMVLGATDGTVYTGLPVLARLTLQFTPSTFVSVSGGPVFSGGPSPVGGMVRGGLGFDVHPNWSIETGASSTWVGYNSQLDARSMFLMGDVGPTFRYRWFSANASVMAGAEFDQGSPAPAFGGLLTLRGEWP